MSSTKTVNSVECGLVRICPASHHWSEPKKYPIPLQSVQVEASVVHAVAQVQITQVFVNTEEEPMEAVYYFPVDPNGAVTHFEAELEGRKIKAVVKPDKEAKEQYEKAIEQKQTAFLGQENNADIYKVRVGYLKPGSSAKIVIGYVTEVKNERDSNAIRFYIPTTVAPRYVPMETTDEKAEDLKNMQFSETSPASMTIKTHISIQGDIKSIESPTHQIVVSSQGPVEGKAGWTKATVELNGTTTDMDRDFVLLVLPAEPHKPRLYIEKLDKSLAVMAHLIPSFKLKEQKAELIFVLDRSGSMGGSSMKLAKEALTLFLHSLPSDCYFNIVGFGSNFELLFPQSVQYDDESLKLAKQHANDLDANMGGTEILAPLRQIYCTEPIPGYLRQIFVITDGEVSNADQVIGLVKAKSHQSRLFALGIGDGASHHLVEGIANAGGNSAFVTYNESVTKKVLQQLKDALQPSLTDVRIKWHGVKDDLAEQQPAPPVVTEKTLLGYGKPSESAQDKAAASTKTLKSYWQAPEQVPPIFDGSQLLVFGIFENPEQNQPTGCTVTAESPDGPLSIDIELSEENDVGATGMLHKLAAIKIVRELELKVAALEYCHSDYGRRLPGNTEEAELYKDKITELAVREDFASKYTSFVAVDTTSTNEDSQDSESWVMKTRMVPSQLAHGWHGHSSATAAAQSVSYPPNPPRPSPSSYPGPPAHVMMASRMSSLPGMRCSQSMPPSYSSSHMYDSSCKQQPYSGMPCYSRIPQQSMQNCQPVQLQQQSPCPQSSPAQQAPSQEQFVCRQSSPAQPPMPTVAPVASAKREGRARRILQIKDPCTGRNVLEQQDFNNDKLKDIVNYQASSGYFKAEESLLRTLGLDVYLTKEVAEKNGWDQVAWTTALALTYLEEKLKDQEESWDLVAKKAKKWLSENHGTEEAAMMAAAASLIKSA